MTQSRLVLALLLPCATALAQDFPRDLIAVTFGGTAVALDSRTGLGEALGATGRTGHNCTARVGRQIYTVEVVGGGTPQRFLNLIDDVTGQATRTVAITRDLRGLAPGGSNSLLAITENGTNDQLVRVSISSGTITVIGSTGFSGLQGLTLHGNTFLAWDVNAGLVRVDHLTGAATDVNPAVGTGGAGVQFLTSMTDGRLLGGHNSLYLIDPTTGAVTLRGSGQYNDLRGAEERFGVFYTFGQGCNGVALNLAGEPRAGGTVTTSSTGNRRGTAGFLVLGFSEVGFRGLPLPLRLDSFLGTVGCFLYAGPEFTVATSANGLGVMVVPVAIPQFTQGLIFHVQHVSLSNGPGGLAFSGGGTVRVRL